jgi:hypothetical protein
MMMLPSLPLKELPRRSSIDGRAELETIDETLGRCCDPVDELARPGESWIEGE